MSRERKVVVILAAIVVAVIVFAFVSDYVGPLGDALRGAPVVIVVTRYVSLGSLVGSAFGGLLLIPCVALGLNPPSDLIFAAVGVAIVWYAHRDNIGRLMRGEERKIEFSTSPAEAGGSGSAPPP